MARTSQRTVKPSKRKVKHKCRITVIGGPPDEYQILAVQLELLGLDQIEAQRRVEAFRKRREAEAEASNQPTNERAQLTEEVS